MRERTDGDIRLEAPDWAEWMRKALHDLCQPLTTLDCLLYLSTPTGAGQAANPAALEQALNEAMVECSRMMTMVRAMQERLAIDEDPAQGARGGH